MKSPSFNTHFSPKETAPIAPKLRLEKAELLAEKAIKVHLLWKDGEDNFKEIISVKNNSGAVKGQ